MLYSFEKSPNTADTVKLQFKPLGIRDEVILVDIWPEIYLSFYSTFAPALGEFTKTAIPT